MWSLCRQGLIAINYPARAANLNRHVTVTEALKLCPNLRVQHVATWREGDARWAYHEEANRDIATHKVSLDPYRLESRRILACIKECLGGMAGGGAGNVDGKEVKVEKASVDEVFMDLSLLVHGRMLERFAELRGEAPYDDLTEVCTSIVSWEADWNRCSVLAKKALADDLL